MSDITGNHKQSPYWCLNTYCGSWIIEKKKVYTGDMGRRMKY